jgi:hypothetical protein
MSESFLSRLFSREQKRQQTAQERWQDLVKDVANGKEPDTVEQVLHDAGKTVADLAAAVQAVQHRRHLAATLAAGRKAVGERAEVQRACAAAAAERERALAAAEEKACAALAPLEQRLKEIDAAEQAARAAHAELVQTAPQALHDQAEAIRARRAALLDLNQLRRKLDEARANARLVDREQVSFERQRAAGKRDAAGLEVEIARREKQWLELQQLQAALEEKMAAS